ncbi:MAG: glycosyltransferase family 2 protein [Lachnospiraceae bacterium]|nr:glycosyltransferase family 2 protein [Lachnospiraceae bacterium]
MISIIVPVYNAEKYIAHTIQMVQNQSYADWELLLVNDGSKDGSVAVIEEYLSDSRIHLLQMPQNGGAARARNMGIEMAHGRYLAYLDADDVWMADKLEKELAFLQSKDAAFVFTAYEFGDENAQGTGKIVTVPETINYRQALSRTVIFTTTVMFDTEKIAKELLKMPEVASEDTASWWKILRNGYTAYGLNENLAVYRRPGKSLSSNKFVAMKRIWKLYREQEQLGVGSSAWYFLGWAIRATMRRI